ncbi:MAG TPA: sugar ABC transporter permease [Pseudonocardiaceae bacterium]|nr:sugar ABC transporter permease [Pseudonocardiaceae bacterium]
MTTATPAKPPPAGSARPVVGETPTAGRAGRRRRIADRQRPLWLLLPGGLLTALVIVIPLLIAVYISLIDLNLYTFREWVRAPFIALRNYFDAVKDEGLLHSVAISVEYAVIVTVVTLPIGVAAGLATQNRFHGRGLVRSVLLIPYVLPAFVVGTIWRIILQPGGIANGLLKHVGVYGGLWLNGPMSFWALVLVQIWSSWPLLYLLTLAGLQSVDPVLYEAATLDGADWRAKLRYVVLPRLRGPVSLGLVIAFLHNVNSFTLPFVLFGVPSPRDVAVLPVLTYTESFQNSAFGLSAAMAVVSLLLIAVPLAVYLRAVRLTVAEDRLR